MAEISDEQLLVDHLAGRAGAFETLVERYTGELMGFVARFVGNSTLAEDIVQETFVQVHLSAPSFDRGRSFRPWIYTIAANKARDQLRSKSRKATVSLDPRVDADAPGSALATIAGTAPDVAEDAMRDEQVVRVREIVHRMPEHLRAILLLGYFQQLPYAEIAEVLSVPLGTVKSRLHAAVAHFSQQWEQANGAERPNATES